VLELYVENSFTESSCKTHLKREDILPFLTDQIWHGWFEQWLKMLGSYLPSAASYEIGLRLADDLAIQQLNHQYRQQNKPTDVLSFAALEANLPQHKEVAMSTPLYLGDIVISIDTAQRQAQERGHSLSTELPWLAAHGLLHLLGWDHPDEATLQQMLNQQLILLQAIDMNIDIVDY